MLNTFLPINLPRSWKVHDDKEIPKTAHTPGVHGHFRQRKENRYQHRPFHYQETTKRADVYWFVHVDTTDEPYTKTYHVRDHHTQRSFLLGSDWDLK